MPAFLLEADSTTHGLWKQRISNYIKYYSEDLSTRRRYLRKLFRFYLGFQSGYTNVYGQSKEQKRGHTSSVKNYFKEHILKFVDTMNINKPRLGIAPNIGDHPAEPFAAQATERFIDKVLYDNRFDTTQYGLGNFNQSLAGNFAVKTYSEKNEAGEWEIKVRTKHNMGNVIVGWAGEDPYKFNYFISLELLTEREMLDFYGEIPKDIDREEDVKMLKSLSSEFDIRSESQLGEHTARGGTQWGKDYEKMSETTLTSDTSGRRFLLIDYWDDKRNIIIIGGRVVQYVEHEYGFNPWDIGKNNPSPTSYYGLSDGDPLIDPQVDFNERSDDESDLIRASSNFKYVIKNVHDFNAEEMKKGSSQFIELSGENVAIDALTIPVNIFPSQQNISRTLKAMHDLAVPEVVFATGITGLSGRAMAVAWQPMKAKIERKQTEWERVLTSVCEKIQVLADKHFNFQFLKDPSTGEFAPRQVFFRWADILPTTKSGELQDILNKVNIMKLPLKVALEEAGYRDPESIIKQMKEEFKDPELVAIRERMATLTPGGVEAQFNAQQMMRELTERVQTMEGMVGKVAEALGAGEAPGEGGGTPTASAPMLREEGAEGGMPMATAGQMPWGQGVSPGGFARNVGQNILASQGG